MLEPLFIPETTRSILFLNKVDNPILTQSAGVPETAYAVTLCTGKFILRALKGTASVIELLAALRSESGAEIYKFPRVLSARAKVMRPGALMPSSFAKRIFIAVSVFFP